MVGHPIWRGQLRLALVSCPVALHTARRSSGELHFNLINPATGNRTRSIVLDAGTDEELERRDLVRGYEVGEDEYVLLEDADFEAARIESSSVLDIAKFVPAEAIDPVFYDSSYFLAPDGDHPGGKRGGGKKGGGEIGLDVYSVLRQAIGEAGQAALSRVVLSRRERAVAILPMGRGLVLHTLHDAREVADPAPLFAPLPEAVPEAEMVALARRLIERQAGAFDPSDMEDRYEARLREVIEAKRRGQKPAPRESAPRQDNVVDLMSALRRSLGQADSSPLHPSKANTAAKPKKAAAAKKPARRRA